jgi:hypothetical protein
MILIAFIFFVLIIAICLAGYAGYQYGKEDGRQEQYELMQSQIDTIPEN